MTMKRTFVVLLVMLGAVLLVGCKHDSKSPSATTETPVATVSLTPAALPPCPVSQDICDFAGQAEGLVRAGNVDALVRGSAWDTPEKRAALSAMLAGFATDGAQLVSIGCPMAAVLLGCGPTFGLGFSSLKQGDDPGPGGAGIVVLSFVRDPACSMRPIYETGVIPTCAPADKVGPPQLAGAFAPTELGVRRVVLNGGLAQGGDLAGRPEGITDTQVRSQWQTYATKPVPAAVEETIDGVRVQKLGLVGYRPMPQMGVLLIASGCWGCEGFTTRIDRVYVSGGKLRRDVLLDPAKPISGLAVKPDLSEIVASICVQGYCGPLNAVTSDSRTELRRSTDGGVTWETLGSFPGIASVQGFVAGQVLLLRAFGDSDPRAWAYEAVTWPDMTPIQRPMTAAEDSWPTVQPSGEVTFPAKDSNSLLRSDGSTYWSFPLKTTVEQVSLFASTFDQRSVVTWSATPGDPSSTRYYVGVFDADRLTAVFRPSRPVYPGPWFAHNAFISWVEATPAELNLTGDPNMSGFSSPFPTVVDIDTGVIAPIEPQFFMDNYGPGNRKFPLAYLPGPFARVNTPRDCLNVRAAPSTTSESLGCIGDGVLLRIGPGTEVLLGSTTWVPLVTPDGRAGWASGEFLER